MDVGWIAIAVFTWIFERIADRGIKYLTEEDPIQKAISRTQEEFPQFKYLHKNPQEMIESKGFKNEVERILHSKEELINVNDLAEVLIDKTNFFNGDRTNPEAIKIVRTFLLFLEDEYLKTEEGHVMIQTRLKDHDRKTDEWFREIKSSLERQDLQVRIIKERDEKIKVLEQTIQALQIDRKERKEALEAIVKGDFDKALALFESIKEKEKVKHADTYYNLGNIHFIKFEFDKALTAYKEAENLKPNDALYKHEIGITLISLGKYRSAIDYLGKALAIYKDIYRKNHPSIANTSNNLGSAWRNLSEYKKAIEYHENALAIYKKVYGEDHPDVAGILNNLGIAWGYLGEYKKAIGYYEKALAIYKKIYGEDHLDVAGTLNNLGLPWGCLGEHKKTIDYCEKALAIYKKVYGEYHPDVAGLLNNIGLAWSFLGEYKKAIGYYEKALAIKIKVYGEDHPSIADTLNDLGIAWGSLGEHKKAIDYFENELRISVKTRGEVHQKTIKIRENLEEIKNRFLD